jgi:3-phosphoshikimate 1-carboxyvinyltransferase
MELGVEFSGNHDVVVVQGRGLRGLQPPARLLDAGNSGTTIRLLTGILVGQRFPSKITGDESLRRRPMQRLIHPLRLMGADLESSNRGTAPLRIKPVKTLQPIVYHMPVASAQVKSAILLAGLYAEGKTIVVELTGTRDHTERMLDLHVREQEGTRVVEVEGEMKIEGKEYFVPGDISSAAFLIAAALLVPHSEVVIKNVGLNPTRTAVLDVFRQMGGSIAIENRRDRAGEPIGDLRAITSELKTGFELNGARVAAVIDEIPILAVTAAFANGVFCVRDAQELRAKESDRIKAIVTNLRALGVEVEEYDDGFAFEGGKALHGANIDSVGDHRIAMAFAVAGLNVKGETTIQNAECTDISFPRFWEILSRLQG